MKKKKDKNTSALLAIIFGGLGFHKFYLGKTVQGIIYLIFCWTFIPALIGVIEGIFLFMLNQNEFNSRYN